MNLRQLKNNRKLEYELSENLSYKYTIYSAPLGAPVQLSCPS